MCKLQSISKYAEICWFRCKMEDQFRVLKDEVLDDIVHKAYRKWSNKYWSQIQITEENRYFSTKHIVICFIRKNTSILTICTIIRTFIIFEYS